MLKAIINNQVKRDCIKTNEDSFTSFIFERLSYLPYEIFESIIRDSTNGIIPNINFKSIKKIFFWPHWDSEGTTNKNYVEPDLFIRFNKYDLLIEAKRYDDKQQKRIQWENQIISYYNEFEKDEKELVFIALGGINNIKTEIIKINDYEQKILKCKWSSILNNTKKISKKLEPTTNILNSNFIIYNILKDIILIFQIYGYSTADWFNIFEYEKGITNFGINTLLNKNNLYE